MAMTSGIATPIVQRSAKPYSRVEGSNATIVRITPRAHWIASIGPVVRASAPERLRTGLPLSLGHEAETRAPRVCGAPYLPVSRSVEANTSRRKYSFLVSFWFETGDAGASKDGGWRGSAEHLGSGRRLYFNQIASLVGFLSGWLGKPDRPEADG